MTTKELENGELELIQMIRNSKDPAQALLSAVGIITQFLNHQHGKTMTEAQQQNHN